MTNTALLQPDQRSAKTELVLAGVFEHVLEMGDIIFAGRAERIAGRGIFRGAGIRGFCSSLGSRNRQFEKFLAERRAKVSESPSHVRQDRTFTWLDDLKKNPLAQKAASETKKLVQNEAAKLFCKDELKKFKESIKNLTFLNDVNEEDLGIDDLFEEAMPSPQAIKKLTKGEIAALEKKMLEDCVARYIVKGVNKAISEGLKGTKGQSFYERFINRD